MIKKRSPKGDGRFTEVSMSSVRRNVSTPSRAGVSLCGRKSTEKASKKS
ncbi:hypothetical protein UFOVP978_66 [uncultured Caudovirales phage]|uniref:Uncharacterized protein n=1 Tax=uncultured Caudovirales phage TaxID=2100421 RepID=A0A6J5Q5K0_9CAUD|nr:hypothetical protein UFOVP978_66 [uncultured Caudovirales phage]